MNGLALFAGIGGLDLGVSVAVPGYRTVCYVEREAFAASVLVARMEDEALDPAPIWDDVCTFDARPWRGVVDIVTAGYPCQPFSAAGKREGKRDERYLWPEVLRIVRDAAVPMVFLENVRPVAFEDAVPDLESLGYRCEVGSLTAEAVGAPHRRNRVFCLAVSDALGREDVAPERGSELADATGSRREGARPDAHEGRAGFVQGSDQLANPNSGRLESGRQQERGEHEGPPGCESDRRRDDWGLEGAQLFPPGPDPELWAGVPPESQPAVCRGAHGPTAALVDRVDRLRALGNGVVPLQAAVAFRLLADRLGGGDVWGDR